MKHIINWTVWTLIGLYAVTIIAVNTPWLQKRLGSQVAQIVGEKLGTKVEVGRVDLGFLNRLILDDVVIYDQQKKQMVKVARMTAKLDMAPLAVGRVSISLAQVFGAHFQLYRQSKDSPANYQFALDSLASNDTTSHTPLDIRVNSFIMRHSSVTYDQWDEVPTAGKFNPYHIDIASISAHVILKALKDDSLNINVKRLSCTERSGLDLRQLSFRLTANNQKANLQAFLLQLPNTSLQVDSIIATYDRQRLDETLSLQGSVGGSRITPSDLACLLPPLGNYTQSVALETDFTYKNHTLNIGRLLAQTGNRDIIIEADGRYHHPTNNRDSWKLNVTRMQVAGESLAFVSKNITPLPDELMRLGDIQLKGVFQSDAPGDLQTVADVNTAIGSAELQLHLMANKDFEGHVATSGIDVGRLFDNGKMGAVAANIAVKGVLDNSRQLAAKGVVDKLEYDNDTYSNITLDATYASDLLTGGLHIDDPKVAASMEFDIKATSLDDAVGMVAIHGLSLPQKDYRLDHLRLESAFNEGRRILTLDSDVAQANLAGDFNFETLMQSLANAVGSKLPTLPGLPPYKRSNNNFNLQLTMRKTDWLNKLFDIDVDLLQPVVLDADVNDMVNRLTVDLSAPAFSYNGKHYQNGDLHITTPRDTMFLAAYINSQNDEGRGLGLSVKGHAADNDLSLALAWNNHDSEKPISGILNLTSHLYRNFANMPEAHINILPSDILIDNSTWNVEPSDILYSTDRLLVDHFAVHKGDQYVIIDGTASKQPNDSVAITLRDIEVAYILDLVSFDAVAFSGLASGKAVVNSAFSDPNANADITVSDFKFENGRMGTLRATVNWNKQEEQIDIHAIADDGPEAITDIDGYVSPSKDYIDLGITAKGTYLDFMHSFTESFVSSITGHANGHLRLAGPLSAINLTGGLMVDGVATITPLNTTYELRHDSITFVRDTIRLDRLTIHDKYDNVGYLSGAVRHKDLTNLSLDLHVTTDKILGYDFTDFGDQSFYGTVLASGTVDISMLGDDVRINCDVTPLAGSTFVYNAAQNDAISDQDFITWKKEALPTANALSSQGGNTGGASSNIYIDFGIDATPEGTLRLLMDPKTDDYITLNGTGKLQASYHNKGTFQMQGTYTVDHGTYDITIQNIFNRKFQFQPGGTIIFSGDPYAAALNLQALYTVNGVSLSELQLGNSFSSNTVRVNCLMNIGGQPSAPQVTFDLDLPTVNADEKQMVRSLLSSQQEMNQQVLYLLGIGRFYAQGQNNADQQPGQQDQTTLAMQSFLSGTLSTQLNNVLNQVIGNESWNFGANISTGTEGWNNAEYEGTVAGRMFDNRLLINGQFGYRDNANKATPSFIGDFDVRYLLLPSGNLALKVYNQTNDRYFTRSSMNTQGLGIIMKKDFNGLRDFFGGSSRAKSLTPARPQE